MHITSESRSQPGNQNGPELYSSVPESKHRFGPSLHLFDHLHTITDVMARKEV